MREVKVVKEGGTWMVQVLDGDRKQQFTCATEAQAQALSKVMAKAEDSKKASAP